jgi:D-lactate dehydrogenase
MTGKRDTELLERLREAVGQRHVLTSARAARYRQGYRTGSGPALAVVRPGSLVELWKVAQACVAADVSIIMQASNTGLTGGSARWRGLSRRAGHHQHHAPFRAACHPRWRAGALPARHHAAPPGAGAAPLWARAAFGDRLLLPRRLGRGRRLQQLGRVARAARAGLYRAGAVRAGPARRYAALVNHLGIALGDDPETMLARLDAGAFAEADIDPALDRRAHDHRYAEHVRDVDSDSPARFNADPRCLFEARAAQAS